MPITRKLLAQDNEDCQQLKVDTLDRYLVNDSEDWYFLFGPNSQLINSNQIIKIAAEFDTNDLDSIRFIAYLYNPNDGSVDNAATCTFNIYLVGQPSWTETLLLSQSGTIQFNSYFLSDISVNSLAPATLDGDSTLMVEAVITRLGDTYRDRVYLNSLGVYDSIIQLRNDVDFLDITKLDE